MLMEIKPIVYFEYDVIFDQANGEADGLKTVQRLFELGYHFIVYDNFGNKMGSISEDIVKRFNEINQYLKSCKLNYGGICYVDVCAVHTSQDDILQKLAFVKTEGFNF